MISISDEQLIKLDELVEIHYQCFIKHYPEYKVTYENVLELNHKKILDIADDLVVGEEKVIDFVIDQLLKDYNKILKKEGTD